MATDPVIKSNGTVVLIPSDGAIQAGQDFPGLQPAGTVQGIQNVGQQPGGSNNEQIQEDLLKKLHKIEIKTLGAIQVMLGLIYISLATIVIVHFRRHYKLFTSIIGYPFWSGIFFIFSGLLSVAAEKYPNKALVMSSVRMNITSAIMAVIGIILYALEIDVNNKRDYSDTEGFFLQSAGTALAVLLLMLTMLEFAITVSLAHLGMKAASNNMATTVLPHDGSPAEGNPEPLVYDEPTLDLLQKDILVTATEPVRMSNGAVVLIPSNLAGVPQTDQYFPGPQLAGTVHYVQYAGQQYGSPNNQENQDGLLNKLRKAETKPLGAIQILIGVILIGLGVISFFTTAPRYNILPLLVGYPFWGGIFFIVSGSLAVSAENYPNSTLVKVSVGMNITSAVMAFIGTALYMVQLAKNSNFKRNELDSATPIGTGLAVFLLLFSILEFAITVSLALFGYEATCCGKNEATTVSPYPVFRQDGSPTEGNPEPPANNNNAESSLKSL